MLASLINYAQSRSCLISLQNQMVNQGQNHIDSPANMLQQQASYEVSATLCLRALIIDEREQKKNFIESSAVNKFVAHDSFASQNAPRKKGRKVSFLLRSKADSAQNFRHSHLRAWPWWGGLVWVVGGKIDCYYRHLRSATFAFSWGRVSRVLRVEWEQAKRTEKRFGEEEEQEVMPTFSAT